MWYPIQMQHEVLHNYLATSQKIQVCYVGEQKQFDWWREIFLLEI